MSGIWHFHFSHGPDVWFVLTNNLQLALWVDNVLFAPRKEIIGDLTEKAAAVVLINPGAVSLQEKTYQ